jgi:hypothetical protein
MIYTDKKFPAADLTIERYGTPHLPASFYVAVAGTKMTDTTMSRASAEEWLGDLTQTGAAQ